MAAFDIVFDFDGVLIDSVDEIIVTAYNTVYHASAARLDDLTPSFAEFMRSNRCRAKSAGEIALLAEWTKNNVQHDPLRLLAPEEFAELTARWNGILPELETGFFRARKEFMARAKDAWLALNRPYQPLWDRLRRGVPRGPRILTYKNPAAVEELCRHYGVTIAAGNLKSTAGHATKAECLGEWVKTSSVPLYYLDDSVRNLKDLKSATAGAAVTLWWASWGYIAPEDEREAIRAGLQPVTQQRVVELLDEQE